MDSSEIIIKNACVITGCGPVFPDGFVHIVGDRIAAVGSMPQAPRSPGAQGPRRPGAQALDVHGRYLLPGFINPHMHLYSTLARGMPVGRMESFGRILKGLWWKLDRALTLDDVYISALLGGIQAIKSGVTTIIDHHASYGAIRGSLGKISGALNEVGIRALLCYEISDRAGKRARDEAVSESALWLEKTAGQNARTGMVGLHASMTLSDGTLDAARELMDIYNVGAHVHVAEGNEDVEITQKLNGMSPAMRLAKKGILREGTLAAHCVHVDRNDLSVIKKTGASVVHNPLSNLGNAVGIAPFLEMRRRKIPVVIGTDGMGAGVAGDIRLASVLHRIGARDAQAGALEVSDAVWKTAPDFISKIFGAKIGRVEEGAGADIIISDAIPPTEVTKENAWWHCLFGVLDSPVRTTIVAGKIRMRDFKIIGIDEAGIATEARELAGRLWKRVS